MGKKKVKKKQPAFIPVSSGHSSKQCCPLRSGVPLERSPWIAEAKPQNDGDIDQRLWFMITYDKINLIVHSQ